MLGRGVKNAAPAGVRATGRARAAADGEVVGLRPAGREDDAARVAVQELRDLLAGPLDGRAGGASGAVDGRGIGREAGEPRSHRLEDVRIQRRRRRDDPRRGRKKCPGVTPVAF